MKVSIELIGMALLTVVAVGVAKGFYLDNLNQMMHMRQEAEALEKLQSQAMFSPQKLSLLQTRLKQALLLESRCNNRNNGPRLSEMAQVLHETAAIEKVGIVSLVGEEGPPLFWQLQVKGDTEGLTRFLHRFEGTALGLTLTSVCLKRANPLVMELGFEVAR